MLPFVAGKSPATRLNSVVFPAPLGPSTARRSPCATSRSTSRTATTPPNRLVSPRRRIAGSAGVDSAVTRSGAGRVLAVVRRLRDVLLAVDAERLVDVLDRVEQLALAAGDLEQVVVRDRLSVLVELHGTDRRCPLQRRHRLAQLLVLPRDVAAGLIEALEQRLHVDVV